MEAFKHSLLVFSHIFMGLAEINDNICLNNLNATFKVAELFHKQPNDLDRLTVSPVYKLYRTPVKTTFRVWCLYS